MTAPDHPTPAVDVVLIGRNEGQRLINALASVQGQARQVVYVDSGSTDTSVAEAQKIGATVVELDMTLPFTAARARNAGFDALTDPEFVLFIDGDCALEPGFLATARDHLAAHPHLGLVTGWRSEIHPEHSLYNRLCDWEWHRPAGMIETCGGDMMVRGPLWRELGGMNTDCIAGEDDDFCKRLGKAGWGLERLPIRMTRHDAAMMTFGQWWSRAVRTGHGFAHIGALHPEFFVRERLRVVFYALLMPVLILLVLTVWPLAALVLALIYPINFLKTSNDLVRQGMDREESWRHGLLLTLSKFPNFIGMLRYYARRLRGAQMRIIEYK